MKKIILVEDDRPIQEAFSMAFVNRGYTIEIFDNGQSILERSVGMPDIFVLDRNISGTNGLQLCNFIKSENAYQQIPVVIMSAFPGIAKEAEEAGADAVITKPFALRVLRETIDRLTDVK
jgi:DNA-binding response OmpR family regulator